MKFAATIVLGWSLAVAVSCSQGELATHAEPTWPKPLPPGPRWRATLSQPTAIDGVLLARAPDRTWVRVARESGRVVTMVASDDVEWIVGASTRELAIASTKSNSLTAIDLNSGREAWRVVCSDLPGTRCRLHGARHGTIAALVGTIEYENPSWSAGVMILDVRAGRVLWKRGIVGLDGDSARVAVDGERVYVYGGQGVWAFDLRSGEPRWRSLTESHPMGVSANLPLAVDGARVAYATGLAGDIRIVAATTGDAIRSIRFANPIDRLAWIDGKLVAASGWGLDALALAKFDATTGGTLARYQAPDHLADHDTFHLERIAFEQGTAYLSFTARNGYRSSARLPDEIHAIDLATGNKLWTHALGRSPPPALVRRGDEPPLIVAQISPSECIALEPGHVARKHHVMIRGALRGWSGDTTRFAGVRLEVGGRSTTTDANGNYSIALEASGAVPIVVADDLDRFGPYRSAIVRALPAFAYVDGAAATLAVDVVVEWHDPK